MEMGFRRSALQEAFFVPGDHGFRRAWLPRTTTKIALEQRAWLVGATTKVAPERRGGYSTSR
jgi:hypothetical protein